MSKLYRNLENLPCEIFGGVVSIGNFDGVHCGHQVLLTELRELAKEVGGPSIVFTFHPAPAAVLAPQFAPIPLTSIQRRADLLFDLGIDFVVACPANREILNQTAREFFGAIICEKLKAKGMVEGPNFRFGKDRGGDTVLLKQLCESNSMNCKIIAAVDEPRSIDYAEPDSETMVSSSRIRAALASGDVAAANKMLTTEYQLEGIIGSGAQRGRELGFPTANLEQIQTLVPENGVYGGTTFIDGQPYLAAIHIGPNPTFGDQSQKVEIHVLDFSGDLYGQSMSVKLVKRIRSIRQFEDTAKLLAQIEADLSTVRSSIQRN